MAAIPIENFMASLPVNLHPEASADIDLVVGFRFPDEGKAFGVHVRRGVAELRHEFPDEPDAALTTDSSIWKAILTGQRNPALALASDDVQVDGSTLDLVRFLRLFGS